MIGFSSLTEENDLDYCLNNSRVQRPLPNKNKFTVAVEGNIGSGKSTFLQYFTKSKNVEVLAEPVELWKSIRGHNTLELMYKDSQRWSLTFQSYVQLTMLQNHCKPHKTPVKLMERTLFSAKYCFVENLNNSGMMPGVDYEVLSAWFDWIVANEDRVNVDLIVYLRATPQTCLQRVQSRKRKEEKGVPISYLESLHELHEDWLIHQTKFKLPAPVLVLDANKDLSELSKEFEERRTEILCGYY